MTPEERERFGVLCEKRFAGGLSDAEAQELTRILDESPDAYESYLRSIDLHVALRDYAAAAPEVEAVPIANPDRRNPMARIALNCSCAWNFFIPGSTTGHEVTCPSCGQTVRIPGRAPGRDVPLSPGEVAGRAQRRQAAVRIMVGVGIAATIAAGAVFAYLSSIEIGTTTPDSSVPRPPLARPPVRPPRPVGDPEIILPPSQPSPSVPLRTDPVAELRQAVYSNIWLCNMATVISECLRYRNLTNECARLQADVATYDGRVKRALVELSKRGEKVALEPYLSPGDQILGFAQRDFTTMKPGEAAQILHAWVNAWRSGPALEQVVVFRGDRRMTLYLEFPEDTRELLALVRTPALAESGNPGSGNVTPLVTVPPELLQDVQTRFDALTPGYRSFLTSAERKRLEDLTGSRKGSSEDIDWLRLRLLGEVIPGFQRESDAIRSRILELEPKLKENPARDVIYRKNGTKIEGQIVEQTAEFVKIKSRFGSAKLPMDDVDRIEMGKGAAIDFPSRFAESKGNLQRLVPLLTWCTEKNLKLESEFTGYVILTLDASNEMARTAAGLGRPSVKPGETKPK